MARLLVFADRAPGDMEWKGTVVWDMILSLAEAHHEVLALTPVDLAGLEGVSHPRLTLAQPAPSFSLRYLGRWMRAVLQFQPEIVHTFALSAKAGESYSWPALVQMLNAFPRVQRWSSVLDERDFAPFPAVNAPLEFEYLRGPWAELGDGADFSPPFRDFIIVPAPVSEWARPQVDLLMLTDFLEHNPEVGACVVGGWGEWDLRRRREGWDLLSPVSARVHLLPGLNLAELARLTRQSRGLWLRSLPATSWRAMVSHRLAEAFSLPTHGAPSRQLPSGSTANFLSRLYSNN